MKLAILRTLLLSATLLVADAATDASTSISSRSVRAGSDPSSFLRPYGYIDSTQGAETSSPGAEPVVSTTTHHPIVHASHWAFSLCFYCIAFVLVIWLVKKYVETWNEFRYYRHDKIKGTTGDSTFGDYCKYQLSTWVATSKTAGAFILLVIAMLVIVFFACLYPFMVGGTGGDPSHALYRIFIWSSAASVDVDTTIGGRLLAFLCTVIGVLLTALLLGFIADAFSQCMTDMREGHCMAMEGNHILIVNCTPGCHLLMGELATAHANEEDTTFVVLDERPAYEVQGELESQVNLKGARLICRSGLLDDPKSLTNVSAHSAKVIILLADKHLPGCEDREHADSKTIRILSALSAIPMKEDAFVVAQCRVDANREIMANLLPHHKVEPMIVGNQIARLMWACSKQHGLINAVMELYGFAGDEVYIKSAKELNLVGITFREAVFRFPDCVIMGINQTACILSEQEIKDIDEQNKGKDPRDRQELTDQELSGKLMLHPDYDYKLVATDELLGLAPDKRSFIADEKVYFDYSSVKGHASSPQRAKALSESKQTLIIGWGHRIGYLLVQMDNELPPGTTVTSYSNRSAEERANEIEEIQARRQHRFKNLKFEYKETGADIEVSYKLKQEIDPDRRYDHVFVLPDTDKINDTRVCDNITVALMAKLKLHFDVVDPVVEVCEAHTVQQLRNLGVYNAVSMDAFESAALAVVSVDRHVKRVYKELFSGNEGNTEIDLVKLEDLVGTARAAKKISFAEITALVANDNKGIVLGWSSIDKATNPFNMNWDLNPLNKSTQRSWVPDDEYTGEPGDRVVLMRSVRPFGT